MKGKLLNAAQLLVVFGLFFFSSWGYIPLEVKKHLQQPDAAVSPKGVVKYIRIKKINTQPRAFSAVVLGPSSAHQCLFQNI